uniref:F-box domain-containing protein n=1 Tax=Rhabditophanes sp. KR3021 TaxID=114890 RepID=A0AC35U9G2_9BILA
MDYLNGKNVIESSNTIALNFIENPSIFVSNNLSNMPCEMKLHFMSYLDLKSLLKMKAVNKMSYTTVSKHSNYLAQKKIADFVIDQTEDGTIKMVLDGSKENFLESLEYLEEISKHIQFTGIIYLRRINPDLLTFIPQCNISSACGIILWDMYRLEMSVLTHFLSKFNCQYIQMSSTNILGDGDQIVEYMGDYISDLSISEDCECFLTDKTLQTLSKKSNKGNALNCIKLKSKGAIFSADGIVEFIKNSYFTHQLPQLHIRAVSCSKSDFIEILEDNLLDDVTHYNRTCYQSVVFQFSHHPLEIIVKEFVSH